MINVGDSVCMPGIKTVFKVTDIREGRNGTLVYGMTDEFSDRIFLGYEQYLITMFPVIKKSESTIKPLPKQLTVGCRHGKLECHVCDWEDNYYSRETNNRCMTKSDTLIQKK